MVRPAADAAALLPLLIAAGARAALVHPLSEERQAAGDPLLGDHRPDGDETRQL
ncbi:hypothetical protein D3C72_1546740 [compost metagenome]